MKRCSKCKTVKPISEFYQSRTHAECKECMKIRNKEAYLKNRNIKAGVTLHGELLTMSIEDALTRWHLRVRCLGVERIIQ